MDQEDRVQEEESEAQSLSQQLVEEAEEEETRAMQALLPQVMFVDCAINLVW